MAERKKVDRKRRKLEKEIEIYKKNSKALCDMLALYSYFIEDDKPLEPASYIVFEEVVKDLEDKDFNVPFKADSIEKLLIQDSNNCYEVLRELRESEYYDDLEGQLYEDYRINLTRQYYRNHYTYDNKEELFKQPFDFFGKMCEYYYGNLTFVSEILCSNIEMPIKVNILYDILKDYLVKSYGITSFESILNPKGAGMDLSRTNYEVKEQKINELCEAFRNEIESNENRKRELVEIILRISRDRAVDWICYLQEKKLVDFMSERKIVNIINCDEIEVSICILLCVNKINKLKKVYQLKDYSYISENIKANDDKFILQSLPVNEIPSFIALSNYKTSIADIELIGKRVLSYQKYFNKENKELVEQIKSAIIHKAKDKEEYKTYCELASMFEQLADYKTYKRQQLKERMERVRAKAQEERELLNARYEFILRLSNMNESLQEQVPGKRVIKELVFQKENQDD